MVEIKKQWYEKNPELLEAEKAAMETIAKDDDKELGFMFFYILYFYWSKSSNSYM